MKELFDALRDLPEPPLVPATQALATARRAARRGTVARTVTAAAAILVVSSAAGVVAHHATTPTLPAAAPPSGPPAPDAPATPAAPAAPAEPAVQAHVAALIQLMRAAVPAGYTAEPVTVSSASTRYVRKVELRPGSYRAITLVRVRRDGAAGTLSVMIGTDVPATGADPCATDRDLGIEGATVQDCAMTSVGGVPVRVVTAHDSGSGQVVSAVRYLAGGYLLVSCSQGERAYWVTHAESATTWEVAVDPGDAPALPAVPIATARLAALAADPAALPS